MSACGFRAYVKQFSSIAAIGAAQRGIARASRRRPPAKSLLRHLSATPRDDKSSAALRFHARG